jgi:hypothetical protein
MIFELRPPKEKSGTMDPLFLLGRDFDSSKNKDGLSYLTMVKNFLVKFF